MKKLLTLGLLLGLTALAGFTAAETVKTQQNYNNEISTQEEISQYTQPTPSNVDYFIYYQLPQNSNQLTTIVNIDGLTGTNDSYGRNFKLELIEYTGSTSSTHLITTFTTPTSGSQYEVTTTTTYSFDFVNYSYKLSLSVQDSTNSTWTEVSHTQVTPTSNLYAPTVVDSYFVTTNPSTGSSTDGAIRFYYVIDNPSNANYNIAVTLKDSTGTVKGTANFTDTTAQTSGYVEFTGLVTDNYQITATSSSVNGLSSGVTYVNLLPNINTPTAYFNASAVNAAAPGLNGQINTCGGITNANGSTGAKVQTSINNGTTWEDTCHVYSVAPGTYQVKGQVVYTSSVTGTAQTHYADLGTKTVIVGTGAYSAPTATVNLTSTNASSPTASDGTIGGTVQWTKNYYNNASIEISLDNTNWVDLSTGITGLSRGTYTVYYRTRWNNGIDSQDQYVTNNTPKTVTVGYDVWNAPDISISGSAQNTSTPTSTDGLVFADTQINNDPSNGSMQMVEYVSVTTSATTPSWTQSSGNVILNNLAVGTTVYITGRVDYDHDYDSGTAMLTTTTQTLSLTVGNQPWQMPTFTTVATGNASGGTQTGQVTATVTQQSGDLEALDSMSLVLKDNTGAVIDSHIMTQSDFTNGVATYTFPYLLPTGSYTVEMTYNYNLQDGNGTTSYQNTVVIPVAISPLARPTATVNNLTTTPDTDPTATNNGSVNFSATIADSAQVITKTTDSIVVNLMKYELNDNGTANDPSDDTYTWQSIDTKNIDTTSNTTSHSVTYDSVTESVGLGEGLYKFNFQIEADPDGAGSNPAFTYTWNSNYKFNVTRTWDAPMSVQTSQARVTEHVMDPSTTLETFSIIYDLTLFNPDNLPYTIQVDLVNLNGSGPTDDVVEQTLTMSQAVTSISFDNVAPGNYELRIHQTSGDAISGISQSSASPTVVAISSASTTEAFVNPYLYNRAQDQKLTINTYTSGGNTYGEMTATLFVQNPDNRNYAFEFVVYDLTTTTAVVDDTYTNNHDANNGAEIHYSYVGGLDITHTYAVLITNVSGVWIDNVDTSYVVVNPDDWAAAMSEPTTTNNAGSIALWASITTVVALALIATPTYIVIRRRVK